MIVRNHTIELKDTSATEMARFRQIMLGIWRQQIEDDKNGDEMKKYIKEHFKTAESLDAKYANNPKKPDEITLKGDRYILNNDNHYQYTDAIALDEVIVTAPISPLIYILLWIKKNIGNNSKELKLSSLPKKALLDSLYGTYEGHFIECNRYLFETIVDLKNIRFEVSFRPVKTVFLLSIFNPQKNLVFRFETNTYEGLEYLANFIGYDSEAFKTTITQQYKKIITEVGNDKDKLDIIYEVIPHFILASLKTDKQMYAAIWTLLDQDISDIGGRDENQGILNILKTLQKKDAKKLFTKLYERPLWVMKLYETFSGEHRRTFVALIMDLCSYNQKTPEAKQQIYLPNGYWPSNVQLTANWNQNKINIENTTTILNNLGNNLAYPTSGLFRSVVNEHKKIYEGAPLNPMDLIAVKSIIEIDNDKNITKEAASNQVALFIKYKVDELTQEAFWDVINVATTLAGGYGAIEVLTIQGTGKLLKTLAVIELTKTIADLVMLTDRAKKALKEVGLDILVDNWTTISISADLSFLSLSFLISLAKYGQKGAKVLNEINEVEHAVHLEKQTEKAFTEIEKEMGVDASKMSDAEFDEFLLKIKKVEELTKSKAEELIKVFSKTEPKITDDLTNLAKNNNGRMEGLEFRLKTFESLNRKLITDGINTPMNDVLRYTIIIDKDITNGVNTILKELKSKGYQTVKIKNTFKEGQIYKGINTNVKSPEGNVFEIQYHTSESFNVKQNINHILYEKYRLLPHDSPEAIHLMNQMMKNANSIKLPKDINTIK